MSHGKLRAEKDCLNCGHYVEEKFCPNCGQENSEPRKPFHYLFTHFFEDLTHYDGQFWGTIKNLLFKPGKLTNTYLQGKRQIFVPPVKLYIFVSFVTFFVLSVIPDSTESGGDKTIVVDKQTEAKNLEDTATNLDEGLNRTRNDGKSINLKITEDGTVITSKSTKFFGAFNIKEYDSLSTVHDDNAMKLARPIAKKIFELQNQDKTQKEINEIFWSNFFKNLPKALFIYLPIFSFILWLFHNKKKWWFFDHGIFTLHYFSFLLLCILFVNITLYLYDLFDNFLLDILYIIFSLCLTFYMVAYFFVAHTKVYQTRKRITLLNGTAIFLINSILLLVLLIGLLFASLLMIH